MLSPSDAAAAPALGLPLQNRPPSAAALGLEPRSEVSRAQALLAELMQARKELTLSATENRKLVSERHALRTRLARAESKARELASAFRGEAQLRSDFVDTHAASSAALRARVADLEQQLIELPELELRLVELEGKLVERDAQIEELVQRSARALESKPPSERNGLRAIRGIGPAYERALLALGIVSVTQIAAWSQEDLRRVAPLLKARLDRIERDDWVGQAKRLLAK